MPCSPFASQAARIASVPAACGLLLLLVLVLSDDRGVLLALNRLPSHTGDALWANLTVLGDAAVVGAALLPWALRSRELCGALLLALLLAALIHPLGEIWQVPRPPRLIPDDVLHVIGPVYKRSSFPSRHALTAFAAAALVVRMSPLRLARAAALPAAALIALSRVVVGVHWPSDVLAGAAIGWLVGCGATSLAPCWPALQRREAQRITGAALTLAAIFSLIDRSGFERAVPSQLAVASVGLALAARTAFVRWRRGGLATGG